MDIVDPRADPQVFCRPARHIHGVVCRGPKYEGPDPISRKRRAGGAAAFTRTNHWRGWRLVNWAAAACKWFFFLNGLQVVLV